MHSTNTTSARSRAETPGLASDTSHDKITSDERAE